jgi:urease accessory protein
MDTITDYLGAFLQANDALFPTGAYAHSFGLEELVRWGLVRDEATLLTFLQKQVIPAQQHLDLPYVRYAFEAALAHDVGTLGALNDEMDALKLCQETRDASTGLGSRRLRTALAISPNALLDKFAAQTKVPHHVIVYGLQMATGGGPLETALTGYFYQALAGPCSAALKLIRIGQEGIQRVLHAGLKEASAAISGSLEIPRDQAGWFNPLLEIASMRHAHAEERLFIS